MDGNPESSTPAKYPPVISKPESHPPQMNLLIDSRFLFVVFPAYAWVDRSGRGFNPRPAQVRKSPPPLYTFPQFQSRKVIFQNESFNWFLFSVRCFPCFRVGGSFRSGVQPPTGSRILSQGGMV